MFTVRHYITEDEHDPFLDWVKKLRDPIAKGHRMLTKAICDTVNTCIHR